MSDSAGRTLSRSFRMLELAACEGGATRGLLDAGWHVTAVDLDGAALRRNPAHMTVQADALVYLAEHGHEYDAVWASFPCQRWSANGANPAAADWPDLITPGRKLLEANGKPWVMENVPKAPLRRDLILCGTMFDLTALDDDGTLLHLDRHRVFESNVPLYLPTGTRPVSPHRCGPRPGVQWAGVYGGARKDKHEARHVRKGGYVPPSESVQSELLGGVEWMTGRGRRECVPPVYAQWVGANLMAEVNERNAA